MAVFDCTSQPQRHIHHLVRCRVVNLPNTVYRRNLESFARSIDRCVALERDLQNASDRNAIKIIGIWQDEKGTEYIAQIGWVPSEAAYEIAIKAPGIQPHAEVIFTSKPDNLGPNIWVDVWCQR